MTAKCVGCGLDERDTYTTKHEIDDLVTAVHITKEEETT